MESRFNLLLAIAVGTASMAQAEPPDVAAAPPSRALAAADVLPDAQPGQCFAKVFEPAQYEGVTEKVLVREASQRIEIVPAEYGWGEETVVVKEASSKLVEVPATYETVTERVQVAPARRIWRRGSGRKAAIAKPRVVAAARSLGLPNQAPPGECFAEFHQPARFETKKEQIVKRPASERIEVAPARYEWVEERVLAKEASEKIVEVAAVYETVSEKVVETPAHTVWKKGRGPIERVDNSTGEIMCRVEVPATFKTVRKRVLKSPATTKRVEIPAEYQTVRVRKVVAPAQEKRIEVPAEYQTLTRKVQVGDASTSWRPKGSGGPGEPTGRTLCSAEIPAKMQTVKKQQIKTPAAIRTIEVPAETKTLRVRKLLRPAQEKRIELPAEYATLTQKKQVSAEKLSWQPVLCQTNTSPELISQIQRALKDSGVDPGPIDGILGRQTMAAMNEFQQRKGFAQGGITLDTIAALGVKVGR